MNEHRFVQAADKIASLAATATNLVPFWQSVTDVVTDVVPFYWTPCWYTLDPASLLITSHFHYGLNEFPAEWLTHEYFGDDVNKLIDVVRSPTGISTLHEATNGDPSGSLRWQENMKLGGEQELLLALRTRSGEVWGALGLYREPNRPLFDTLEKRFLKTVSTHLAHGAQRSLIMGEATDPDSPGAPGLLVLNKRWQVESMTPGVDRWLEALPDGNAGSGQLPSSVLAVAATAARQGESGGPAELAMARVLTRSNQWVVLHGASMNTGDRRRVAVIVEPAHPARIYPLLMAAYDLTERERDVTRLILQGNSTVEIAEAMVVSVHTVQQHLKSIFDKTGVRSRRDLVGKVFFSHYEPRFRDNERRVADNKPVRGGPFEGHTTGNK